MVINMRIRKSLYPKTKRVGAHEINILVTEKLDGSNLGLFRINNELVVAQRNWIHFWRPKETTLDKTNAYKGLIEWLDEHGEHLLNNLHEGSGVFGEWIGMGKIDYKDRLDKRFYIFAKANIDGNYEVRNLLYSPSLFIYPFIDQKVPDYMGVVTIVDEFPYSPTKEDLDYLYDVYTKDVGEGVEGFIVINNNEISKYVRMKHGTLIDHFGKWEDKNVVENE